MGYLTRSSRRANSQSAKPATQRKLSVPKPRPKRAYSAHTGNAPISEPKKSSETVWEDPPVARARPTEADADSTSTEKNPIYIMKPIGQYPSPAEYKSVGLKPPPKHVRKVTKWVGDTDEEEEDLMTTDTPITPTAEEAMLSDSSCIDKQGDRFTGGVNPVALKSSIEKMVRRDMGVTVNGEVNGDDPDKTNLATPVSEAFDLHLLPPSTAHPSLSPAETPVQTPADEVLTDSILTVPDTLLSAPDPDTPLHQTQSPPATAVADAGMASEADKSTTGRNFIDVLNHIPQPASDVYDVPQLKKILENAISHSKVIGDDDVALSLTYFWSEVKSDEFKLALIHNIGREKKDHRLELALRTILSHSVQEADLWYKEFSAKCAQVELRPEYESDSSSSLSSAKSVAAEPGKPSFKVSDIYRDTSGPKLEELFVNGKTNTAPYKRPKKPVRVNENSFKRRHEWETDPAMSEKMRNKRARFAKEANVEEISVKPSSIRPELPDSEIQPDEPDKDVDAPPVPDLSPRSKRAEERKERQKKQDHDKGKAPASKKQKKTSTTKSPSVPANNRSRSLSNASTKRPALKNWRQNWMARFRPDSKDNDAENIDNCAWCGGGGKLLCCDTCENAFHFKCVKTANKNSLKDEWFCPNCDAQHEFTFAILAADTLEKSDYCPPTEIKEYFAGVGEVVQYDLGDSEDEDANGPGDSSPCKKQRFFQTVPHIPRLTKPAKPGTLTPAYNDPSLLKLMENGHVILCNKCGKSTDNVRPIIKCDYCPCRFHMDCLDPPRAIPPNPVVGWMCPNHVTPEDLLAIKIVDGNVQERRVRRPRNLLLVDAEPNTSYDRDSTFDDDWRADRLRFPPGDMIMDFVSAVKEDRKNTNKEVAERLARRMVAVTTLAVKDLARNGGNASEEWMQNFESLCESEAQHVRAGDSRDREISAADALLDMLHGGQQQSTPLSSSQPEQPADETPATVEAEKDTKESPTTKPAA
ncbi:hypothetical protein N7494_011858 [Penicillium frequentans]|uniref:PHD-type domain-containing protein n=1 Tax=Penicillium frequentans TaxID=3151616 RepID=A0AAD6CKF9_9EURO|nr:hypothetical protein N7494_011858 [Penicillium glabrum]